MIIGSYRGAASLAAYERWQAITSQNIAASSKPGFKRSEVSFESVAQGLDRANGTAPGSSMPTINSKTNFAQGELRRTGSELDFAIQGPGFFQVQRENRELGYTRDGQFRVSPDRKLVTKQGFAVMGEGGAPIMLNPDGGAISINQEGSIMQGNQIVGKVAIYDSKDPQELRRLGDVMFGAAQGQRLERVEIPNVVNGYVESSNVSPLSEMVNLINVSRAYEACQKTMTNDGDATDKAIQILGNS